MIAEVFDSFESDPSPHEAPRTIAVLGSNVAADVERSIRNLKSVRYQDHGWKHKNDMKKEAYTTMYSFIFYSSRGMTSGIGFRRAKPLQRSDRHLGLFMRKFRIEETVETPQKPKGSKTSLMLETVEKTPQESSSNKRLLHCSLVELLSSLQCAVWS